MIKPLLVKTSKYIIALAFIAAFSNHASAQTDADAIMIPKNYFCTGLMYGHSDWDHYWEGDFKRTNGNLGHVSSQTVAAMVNYGVSDKFNILLNLPYMATKASAGTLKGQNGLQDISLFLKYMPVEVQVGKGVVSLYGIGGVSIPASNYEADFLPLALGAHSKNLMARFMADYQRSNFFTTASAQYVHRSNITIDRNSYYTTEMHYTNQVDIPNMMVYNGRMGYRSESWIAEAVAENYTSLGGFDIRKNDMPFPSNKMNWTTLGANFKYTFSKPAGLELTAGGDYVISGRNVGQSTVLHGGVYYLFSIKKDKKDKK
ncbi:hypothetical protein [Mucilaginibacter polytrichastri]|uniref:Transporter n=1 Tax=Mucilaginibacter polytrichastri TaxID=1302689 RepID=A0A1Q5ZST8_9SPHI|nr:hypothetical protein [Mucilaginibacter polytrichastri]OKS84803.1 hypothetical protein RG47T_0236 [Mucilaginibacter polytrichastri]SFT00090.1 hypothetical protein SAMN04487890_1086 [Mucilaginibacter polytrichastri]